MQDVVELSTSPELNVSDLPAFIKGFQLFADLGLDSVDKVVQYASSASCAELVRQARDAASKRIERY
eukprot:3273419-Prymnesium_polylepis.1